MQSIASESLTIDRKARANMPFYDLDLRLAEVRTCDFEEVVIDFSSERAMAAGRKAAWAIDEFLNNKAN